MSDVSPPSPEVAGPGPWPPAVRSARNRQWPVVACLIVTQLLTLAFAIGAWFRASPTNNTSPSPAYTSQQVADAKSKVCAAYDKVHSAIKASGARDMGSDPTSQLAYALNGRQAFMTGSEYLRTILSEQPATPIELATAVRKLTDIFQELTVDYLNGAPDSEMDPVVHAGDDETSNVERLCR